MKKGIAVCYIGTSNIVVPGNKSSYPAEHRDKSRLCYYSSFFNSLEINSSFYKVPMPATFAKWAAEVPPSFRFSFKLSKEITHVAELKFEPGKIQQFLNSAGNLHDKMGCLLIQFPGKITIEYYKQVEEILATIHQDDEGRKWKIAVEFRHPGWYIGEGLELIDEYNASLVLHDIPKARNTVINKNAAFVFIRFHGPAGDYRGSYENKQLKEYAEMLHGFLQQGKDVYAYFNNTIGNAFENARDLQAMMSALNNKKVKKKSPGSRPIKRQESFR